MQVKLYLIQIRNFYTTGYQKLIAEYESFVNALIWISIQTQIVVVFISTGFKFINNDTFYDNYYFFSSGYATWLSISGLISSYSTSLFNINPYGNNFTFDIKLLLLENFRWFIFSIFALLPFIFIKLYTVGLIGVIYVFLGLTLALLTSSFICFFLKTLSIYISDFSRVISPLLFLLLIFSGIFIQDLNYKNSLNPFLFSLFVIRL